LIIGLLELLERPSESVAEDLLPRWEKGESRLNEGGSMLAIPGKVGRLNTCRTMDGLSEISGFVRCREER